MNQESAAARSRLFFSAVFVLELAGHFPRFVALGYRLAAFSPLHYCLEAFGLRIATKPQVLRVVACDAVEHGGECLGLLEAHRRHLTGSTMSLCIAR